MAPLHLARRGLRRNTVAPDQRGQPARRPRPSVLATPLLMVVLRLCLRGPARGQPPSAWALALEPGRRPNGHRPDLISRRGYRQAPGEVAAKSAAEAQQLKRPSRKLEREDLDISFARSSGPGGQNVNKVNTKVDARLDIRNTGFLPDWVQDKLIEQQRGRVNSNGILRVEADEERTQADNLRIALSKIQAMIDQAAYIPPPPDQQKQKVLIARKKRANEKRLKDKKIRSEKKQKYRKSLF